MIFVRVSDDTQIVSYGQFKLVVYLSKTVKKNQL